MRLNDLNFQAVLTSKNNFITMDQLQQKVDNDTGMMGMDPQACECQNDSNIRPQKEIPVDVIPVGDSNNNSNNSKLTYESTLTSVPQHMRNHVLDGNLDLVSLATIKEIKDVSPFVRWLEMEVHNRDMTFKAGQWVDFFVPGSTIVGCFSICSTPKRLKDEGRLELAITYSESPPAKWVHFKCHIGDQVSIKIGGDFFWDPTELHQSEFTNFEYDLLLIAGGIGINPIHSIFRSAYEVRQQWPEKRVVEGAPKCTTLLFSGKTMEELLFRDSIEDIWDMDWDMYVKQFITRETNPIYVVPSLQNLCCSSIRMTVDRFDVDKLPIPENLKDDLRDHQAWPSAKDPYDSYAIEDIYSRITKDYLQENFFKDRFDKPVLAYICGPPSMIDDFVKILVECGVPYSSIYFEKWG